MTRIWIVLLTALSFMSLTGCATRHLEWNHASGSNAGFPRDKYICVQESRVQPTGVYIGRNAGWYQLADQIAAGAESAKLYRLCMEARGWTGTYVQQ